MNIFPRAKPTSVMVVPVVLHTNNLINPQSKVLINNLGSTLYLVSLPAPVEKKSFPPQLLSHSHGEKDYYSIAVRSKLEVEGLGARLVPHSCS